jgi:hypothetical protein
VVRGPLGVRDAYSGGPQLFRKLNNFSQQINKVYIHKKAKSEIENFKTLCKSEGILNWSLKIKLVPSAWFVGAAQAPSVGDESDLRFLHIFQFVY